MSTTLSPSPSQTLQSLTTTYRTLESTLQTHIQTRQRLSAQEQENASVSREFNSLPDDATIYKMIGPVLLKQDRAEAVLGVEGRLEFIGGELARVEAQIKTSQEKLDEAREQVYQAQLQQQQLQEGPGGEEQQAVDA